MSSWGVPLGSLGPFGSFSGKKGFFGANFLKNPSFLAFLHVFDPSKLVKGRQKASEMAIFGEKAGFSTKMSFLKKNLKIGV